ncbi:hypothetical protein LMIY3S_00337 [Labrys miyagiensis]
MTSSSAHWEQAWDSYFIILRRALQELAVSNVKTRRQLYERAEKAQRELFDEGDQAPDPDEIDYHHRLFRTTVRLLENDIRADVDIFDESYVPEGLRETARKLAQARAIRLSRKEAALAREAQGLAGQGRDLLARASPAELELIAHLHNGLRLADPTRETGRKGASAPSAIGVVRALLIVQFQLIASESRFAVIWLLIQPAVLLTLISLIYFILQTQFIMNMDVPTFALLGSTTWIMCRQVIFRISTALVYNRIFINIPSVRPIHVVLTQAILYLLIFSVVFVVLLTCGRAVNMTSLPSNLFGVAVYILAMWLYALGLGLVFGGIAVYWPFFLRLASVIERALQLFSSVFFVTEQLPEEYKPWILWCPTAHGMQLLRSAYFPGYTSSDASVPYFWLCLIVVLGAGFLAERNARPQIQPL